MRLKSIIGYGFLALITVLYFIPKTNLYYKLEHILQPHGIILHDEHVDDKRFWLEISNGRLYIQKLESLYVQRIQIMLFGVYNRVYFDDIMLASSLEQFVPKHIDTASVHYALYDPLNVRGNVLGDFGRADLDFDLYNGLFKADIEVSELMRSKFPTTLENFTRDKQGVYHYEYHF